MLVCELESVHCDFTLGVTIIWIRQVKFYALLPMLSTLKFAN